MYSEAPNNDTQQAKQNGELLFSNIHLTKVLLIHGKLLVRRKITDNSPLTPTPPTLVKRMEYVMWRAGVLGCCLAPKNVSSLLRDVTPLMLLACCRNVVGFNYKMT